MHSIKKNQIVVVALVIMIVIAGYLNYNSQIDKGKKVAGDISEQSQVAEGDEDSNFGEDVLLPQDESGQSQTAEGEDSTQDQTAEGENSTPDQTAEGLSLIHIFSGSADVHGREGRHFRARQYSPG